ncbi:MAG: exopolysaccharide biosynthesis polyprenyl glycosylphosphotransferase [Verrucomicrobia bacterium]|nr:exopolysaccharide biosynthesis polyprenyl glycosylphosphotransferase [Verrucomicrobiota bacterium]NBS84024.1 exopolysaccharide biosynthesis polyprenyl glycosylphosphotransferase [Verrucomicrobiota bacterium]
MNLSDVRQVRIWLQLIDGLLSATAMILAFFIRVYVLPRWIPLENREIGDFILYLPYVALMGFLAPFVMRRRGVYRSFAGRGQGLNWANLFEIGLILFLVGISVVFFFKQSPSRVVFILFVPIFFVFLLARENLFHHFRLIRRKQDHASVRLLLATDSTEVTDRWINLFSDSPVGVRVTRTFTAGGGPIEPFIHAIHEDSAGIVLFDVHAKNMGWAAQAIKACEEEGVESWLSTDFVGTQIARAQFEEVMNRNLLIFRATRAGTWQSLLKIVFDRMTSTLLLVLLAPLFLGIWLAIKLESPGPAFFRQRRSGRHGDPFTMYKFRTMQSDAEMKKSELEALNEMKGPVFKLKNDPRVTRVGAFLRFTSLDELPQLINVFFGHMSLVGPRPLPTYETLAMTANAQRRRLSVSPGMTCLWQISGRNDVADFSDWVRLDLEYIDQWSLWLDFQILLRTIPAVLFGRGAR